MSPSCYSTPFLGRENFGDSAKIRVILRIFIAHARTGRISTSGVKSDVTIVFLGPDFLKGAKMSAIRVHFNQSINQFICPEIQYTLYRTRMEDATSANRCP